MELPVTRSVCSFRWSGSCFCCHRRRAERAQAQPHRYDDRDCFSGLVTDVQFSLLGCCYLAGCLTGVSGSGL